MRRVVHIRKERRLFYGVVAAVTIILIAGLVLIHELSRPVRAQTFTTPNISTPAIVEPVAVKGTYASFTYPSSLQPTQEGQVPSGDEVAIYNYTKTDVEPWHLVVEINHLHEPTLTDDSSYMLRKDDPSRYLASVLTVGENSFTIMTDSQAGGFSEAAFILDGDYSADVSLTGDDGSNEAGLNAAFKQVLSSWQWQG